LLQKALFTMKRGVQAETLGFHSKRKEERRRKTSLRTQDIEEASGDRNKWVSERKGGKGGGKEGRRNYSRK